MGAFASVSDAGETADAPRIPAGPKPAAIRSSAGVVVAVPVIVPKPVLWLLVRRKYDCAVRITGLPEATVSIPAPAGPARRAMSYFKANGKVPDTMRRQWSTFATQPDAYIVGCHVEWFDNGKAKGKTLRLTVMIGGVSGIPAVRKSFLYGPICNWEDKTCKTQGWSLMR